QVNRPRYVTESHPTLRPKVVQKPTAHHEWNHQAMRSKESTREDTGGPMVRVPISGTISLDNATVGYAAMAQAALTIAFKIMGFINKPTIRQHSNGRARSGPSNARHQRRQARHVQMTASPQDAARLPSAEWRG